jgi:hypothetical protein
MTFQFLCPQGHLLQGEEAHMGMQCECPECGTAFIIPTIASGAGVGEAAPHPEPYVASSESEVDDLIATVDVAENSLELSRARGDSREPPHEAEEEIPSPLETTVADPLAPPAAPRAQLDSEFSDLGQAVVDEELLHIPCPNGHELETPTDMLGQRALCPQCGVEFLLRREKSIEHQFQLKVIDRQRGEFWLRAAIVAAIIVIFALVVMIVLMSVT